MTRTIIIGDIHGCYDELCELLDRVAPASDDRIIAIGDIVDRGPDSEMVLAFFRDTSNAISLMGNHERKHIRSARGLTRPALSQLIVRQQLGDRYPEWLRFMQKFPRHLELPEAILVHGFLEPRLPLDQQLDTVVIGTLSGEAHMSDKYPGAWYDHHQSYKPVVVGHHDYLRTGEPLIRERRVYAIDTGCAHGGRLTALILPEFRIVSVVSRGDHWTAQRQRYALLAGSQRSNLDLDWETLSRFATAAGGDHLPPDERERAEQCAVLLRECERLEAQIIEAATALYRKLREGLASSQDWTALSDRQQAARFGQRASGHRAAALLFAVRQGPFDSAALRKQAGTPRALLEWGRKLGLAAGAGPANEYKE